MHCTSMKSTHSIQALDEESKKFSLREIVPVANHHDKTGEYPWDVIKKAQYG